MTIRFIVHMFIFRTAVMVTRIVKVASQRWLSLVVSGVHSVLGLLFSISWLCLVVLTSSSISVMVLLVFVSLSFIPH